MTNKSNSNAPVVLRIFSYLPNPRVWKSQIAGHLCGVNVEVLGDKPPKLGQWLWDYDARSLGDDERGEDSPYARVSRRGFSGTLFKTDDFLRAHPFGTVPAGFAPGGGVGIFESNSILRAVARAGAGADSVGVHLYGEDDYQASRIDSFLDANLVFAREAQVYLLDMAEMSEAVYQRMAAAYEFYLAGIENALSETAHIAGEALSIADISFVCDFAQFLREGHYAEALQAKGLQLISEHGPEQYPRAYQHMLDLSETEVFSQYMGSYLNWYRTKLAEQ